jgi:hypothetical protein
LDSTDVLQSIAEVGIALAGFGGIAAGLGYRARGVWSREDRTRLVGMARTSLLVVFASFLPFAIASLGFAATWRVASALVLVLHASALVRSAPLLYRTIRTGGAGSTGGYSRTAASLTLVAQLSALLFLLVASIGVAPAREFGLYLSALLLILFVASVLFVRLLVASFQGNEPAA